ncbi:hypothetical protein F5Y16DRAFT_403734 [Xylariaceae sp. FL0255]|nr:hypothetical protein F5Y16DRAFT_403734 [Xylariaceae sp. FL0255]
MASIRRLGFTRAPNRELRSPGRFQEHSLQSFELWFNAIKKRELANDTAGGQIRTSPLLPGEEQSVTDKQAASLSTAESPVVNLRGEAIDIDNELLGRRVLSTVSHIPDTRSYANSKCSAQEEACCQLKTAASGVLQMNQRKGNPNKEHQRASDCEHFVNSPTESMTQRSIGSPIPSLSNGTYITSELTDTVVSHKSLQGASQNSTGSSMSLSSEDVDSLKKNLSSKFWQLLKIQSDTRNSLEEIVGTIRRGGSYFHDDHWTSSFQVLVDEVLQTAVTQREPITYWNKRLNNGEGYHLKGDEAELAKEVCNDVARFIQGASWSLTTGCCCRSKYLRDPTWSTYTWFCRQIYRILAEFPGLDGREPVRPSLEDLSSTWIPRLGLDYQDANITAHS